MAIASSDVSAGDDILATDHNNLRADLLTNDISMAGVKTFNDDIKLDSGEGIYFDADGDSDTRIYEYSEDVLYFVTGGTTRAILGNTTLTLSSLDLYLTATNKLYLDGGSDSYIYEVSANKINVVVGGSPVATFLSGGVSTYLKYSSGSAYAGWADAAQFDMSDGTNIIYMLGSDWVPSTNGGQDLGNSASNDWGTIYYHTLSQDSGKDGKSDITIVDKNTYIADKLPSPKKYKRKCDIARGNDDIEYGLIAEECPEETIKYDKDNKPMIQTNALIAYMGGVIKNMDNTIKILESRIKVLEDTK